MCAVFSIGSFIGLVCGLFLIVIITALAKISLSDFTRNLKAFLWLFILTFILHLFFTQTGEERMALPVFGWELSRQGLERGIFYCCRIALLLGFSYIFMAATSPLEIADGLERTLLPLKKVGFPAHETALILSIALRFVPTLLDEAKRIRDAQLCRGARLQGNMLLKIKGFSAMLIPLFASALRRADTLALAMEARGYRGGEGRTSYVELKFKLNDLFTLIISCTVAGGLFII